MRQWFPRHEISPLRRGGASAWYLHNYEDRHTHRVYVTAPTESDYAVITKIFTFEVSDHVFYDFWCHYDA
jgi:hypothetical protein